MSPAARSGCRSRRTAPSRRARFSPDGKRIVTGSWDNSAKIWNVETGRAELKLIGHGGYVNSAEFSPDGKWILTASDDRTARIWDAKTGACPFARSSATKTVSPRRRFRPMATMCSPPPATRRPAFGTPRRPSSCTSTRAINGACCPPPFRKTAARIITGSADNTARIWDVETEQPLATLAGHTAAVTSVAFSPDGLRASHRQPRRHRQALGCRTRGKEVLTLKGHTQEVTSVTFSADGSYVLTASRDGTAIIWLAATGARMK